MFTVISNKRKIEEATSGKDDVAPVYLLEELWEIVRSSGPETAVGFVEFINKRMGMKSPIIKQKALRLIKYLCKKGASDFKRHMAKRAGAVRELTHYRGDPDPYKGDVPNQKVRDTAKEALEAIFAPTETPSYSSAGTSSMHGRIQGFGSSNASDGFSTAAVGKPAGLTGFGNPRYETGQSSSSNRYSRGYEPVGESGSRAEGIGSMIQRVGSGALSPKAIMGSIAAKGNEFLSGRRGPSILHDDEQGGYSSDEADRGYDKPQVNGISAAAVAAGQGGEEARLVDQICTPGGLRAQPTAEDLAVFVDSTGSMNGPLLAERLEDKVAGSSWQASLRALCALEAVVTRGHTASCGEIAVHFQTNPDVLERAAGSPQASVRQRALRLLQLLGIGGDSAPAAPKAAAAAPVPDLLGGLQEEAPAAPPPASSNPADLLGDLMAPAPGSEAAAAPAAPAAGGMFSGLDISAPTTSQQPPQPPAASALDLFSGLDAPGAAPAAAPAAAGADLLAGLSTQHNGAAASTALDVDLFGGPATAAGAAPAAELSEMFAGLSTAGSGALQGQPPRQPTPQQLAAQRTNSLERQADPLSSLGIPQSSQTPMGYGLSAQRGSSPAASQPLPGMNAGMAAAAGGWPGMHGAAPGQQFNPQQLNPQQLQYLRQLQYMQYMQMQAMQAQARGMMPGGMAPFADQAASPFSSQQQFSSRAPPAGSNGSGAPIALEALTGPSQPSSLAQSSSLGITSRSDFDFVGEHVKSLRGKK